MMNDEQISPEGQYHDSNALPVCASPQSEPSPGMGAPVDLETNRQQGSAALPDARNADNGESISDEEFEKGAYEMASDFEAQLGLLMLEGDESKRQLHFPTRPRLLKLKACFRGQARKLIRADQADELVRNFPELGGSTHALLSGEFVMGSIIDRVRLIHGEPRAIWVATLSLGTVNIETLVSAAQAGVQVTVLLSHFFESKEKEVYAAIARQLMPAGVKIYIGRLHTKIILFDYPECPFTVTGSANLRSSNNLEQADIFAGPELFIFHRQWMKEVAARCEAGINPTHAIKL